MLGLVAALLSGLSFTLNSIFIRKGMFRSGESFSPLVISLSLGTVIFGIASYITGDMELLSKLTWVGIGSLVGAGIIHFLIGRFLGYVSIHLIGNNRVVSIQNTYIILAALMGVFLLGEPLTVGLVVALILVAGGVFLVGTEGGSDAGKSNIDKTTLLKGVLAAIVSSICWAISPVLVKIGLKELDSPLAGTFISYAAAFVLVIFSLFKSANSQKLRVLERNSLILFLIASTLIAAAQILRYVALSLSPVSLVAPLLASTKLLFIFPLSFISNRAIESFETRTIVSALLVLAGALIIFFIA